MYDQFSDDLHIYLIIEIKSLLNLRVLKVDVGILRLIHLWLKIQEIFPEGVANNVNKRVRTKEFFPVFLTKSGFIYILH